MNQDQISSHWYSLPTGERNEDSSLLILPTGCTPITMLAQYFPTYYVQIGFVALLSAFILIKYCSLPSLLASLIFVSQVTIKHQMGRALRSLGRLLPGPYSEHQDRFPFQR
jgi:hypothetical protein